MFEDFDVGSDWSQMFDGSGLQGTGGGILDALGSVVGADGWDGGFPDAASDTGGALTQVAEGSPNVGSVSDPEALGLLGGQGEAPSVGANALSKIGKLFQDKSGDLDLGKVLKVGLGVSSFVNSITSRAKQAKEQQQAALQNALQQQQRGSWTPQQQQWANSFFQTPRGNPGVQYASQMQSPIVPGKGYAHGGDVEEDPGALGLVFGQGGGQDDMVEARLSPGEYVFDADTVSLIGDGSNEAGAQRLDMWRQALREHKRSAPSDEIPPPADDPMAYLPEGGE